MKNLRFTFDNLCRNLIFTIALLFLTNLHAQELFNDLRTDEEFEFIAQYEGLTTSIGHFGNYTYFNNGGNINILERTGYNDFTLVNSFHCGYNFCQDITISSNKMFVSTYGGGVSIYDLNDPANPQLIGTANEAYRTIKSCIVSDTLLIALAGGYGYAFLYNISNPSYPEYLSNITYINNRQHTFALSNNILYGFEQMGYSGPQYLRGYDISNPRYPNLHAELQLSPDYQAPWPDDIIANKSNLFVAFNDTLKVYDISATDTIAYQTQFAVPKEINQLKLEDNLMYIATQDSGVFIFDVSDIFAPEYIGFYNCPAFFDELDVNADFIHSALENKGFKITNKADVQNIQDVYSYSETDEIYAVHIDNNLAYLGMVNSGFQIVDISNLLQPVKYGSIDSLCDIREIQAVPGYLYALNIKKTKLYIIDVQDPLNPHLVENSSFTENYFYDYSIHDNKLYVLSDSSKVNIYNISTPASPILIKSIPEVSGSRFAVDGAWRMVLGDSQKITLFKIVNNNFIIPLDQINIRNYVANFDNGIYKIKTDYPYVYARTQVGLIVFKIINNNDLVVCDAMIFGGWDDFTYDIAYNDSYIYISGTFGIVILDQTDPSHLIVKQHIKKYAPQISPFAKNVCFTGGRSGYYFYGKDFDSIEDKYSTQDGLQLHLQPNPCNSAATIHFSIPNNEKARLEVYNLTGQKLKDFDITNKNQMVLHTNSFTSGVYLLKIATKTQSSVKKFVVRH